MRTRTSLLSLFSFGKGADVDRRSGRQKAASQPRLEALESRELMAYSGVIENAVAYNPTWPNWSTKHAEQLQDSDFFTGAFRGLWGEKNGKGRNDLQTIKDAGFNTVRLYNWGPSRQGSDANGKPSGKYDAHLPFLNDANKLGLKVIVPVSNYFLGDDKYAWKEKHPDSNYSFDSAPEDIRNDLKQFIASVTTADGKLSKAVTSISIGNEMDLGIDQDPGATAKLQRAMWWVVNLQKRLTAAFGTSLPEHFLTIPISNADQSNVWTAGKSSGGNTATTISDTNLKAHPPWGANIFNGLTINIVKGTGAGQTRTVVANNTTQLTVDTPWDTIPDATSEYQVVNPTPIDWFQVFTDGATQGERVPVGTVPDGPAGRFTENVKGLGGYSWYQTEFYNSLNMFQAGDQLKNTLVQYDTGVPSGPSWSQTWPNQKFTVPLLLTELGTSRFNTTDAQQAEAVAIDQAQVAQNVLKTSTNLMGYTIFEFNDEANKNNYIGPPSSENFFGVLQYNTNQANFRQGNLLYRMSTGATKWAGGTLPNYDYPVYSLIPVGGSNGGTLLSQLKGIFQQTS